MRYVISVGEDETGPLIQGDDGAPCMYNSMREAGEAAKMILRGTLKQQFPTWGAFVHKLVGCAFYLPIPGLPAECDLVDETIVPEREEKDDDVGNN